MLGLGYVCDSIAISHEYYFRKTASNKDIKRVKDMNNETSLTFKNYRKQLNCIRKGSHDAEREKEGGETYVSEKF